MNVNKYKGYAPILVRISLSIVFLWFGISQLINPESFLGYIPQWLFSHSSGIQHWHSLQLMHNLPLTTHFIIMANGVFQTLFGLLLLLGFFTRLSSLLLGFNLFMIMIGLGYNDIAVRDFGLALATLSIFLHGLINGL